jgi:hypothetical protein
MPLAGLFLQGFPPVPKPLGNRKLRYAAFAWFDGPRIAKVLSWLHTVGKIRHCR